MQDLEAMIDMATRHVTEGRRIVAEQRLLIAQNRGGPDAPQLLKTFERSLEIFESDLERLLHEQGRTKKA